MDAFELIKERPGFHAFPDGQSRCMSLGDAGLKWIATQLSAIKNPITLETGNGLTTVLMTIFAEKHFSISPDSATYKRIIDYCANKGIATAGLQYIVGHSEEVLPSLDIKDEFLDMVLIDGCHGFPMPFVDYAYTFKKIKIGGYLVIDDIQLVTGMFLKDFLLEEDAWKLVDYFDCKTCAFRKEHHTSNKEWCNQSYINRTNDQVQGCIAASGVAVIKRLHLDVIAG